MGTAKKSVAKKPAVKKTATSKATVKKATAVQTTVKKTAVKKTAVRKTAVKRPLSSQAEVGRIGNASLQALATDIDRQMKMLAEMNTRVLIAKDQLADFQEMVAAKIKAFQQKNAGKPAEIQKDIMASIRETRAEAAKMITDSKALHETYALVSRQFEKGRVAAAKELKKAEAVFLEKLHVLEAKVMKKAGEIKKNLKS